jgi:phosphonatase-like hydrolase
VRLRLVVFDLAGTTVIDDGQVPAAFEAALAAHGVRVTADQVQAVRGASKRQAIASLLAVPPGDPRVAAAFATFRGRLAELYAPGVRAMPGARPAIDRLRQAGVLVALNTGFERDTVALVLDRLGWAEGVVDAIVCGDEVAAGRPEPDLIRAAMTRTGIADPAAVMNVGDTVLDLEAGHRAGVGWNVGVLSGAHGRARLEAAPHTHLIESVADLAGVLDAA